MKTQYFRCWVLLLAAAFLVLWCASVGVTYSASDTVLQEQAAAEAAAVPVRDELGTVSYTHLDVYKRQPSMFSILAMMFMEWQLYSLKMLRMARISSAVRVKEAAT